MKRICIDIETNGLLMEADTIWCAVLHDLDSGSFYEYTKDNLAEFSSRVEKADLIVGHNIQMFDLPLMSKLLGTKYNPNNVFDTLLVSRLLQPDRPIGHSLKAWGSMLGFPKFEYEDFTQYTPEMLKYCRQDVAVTVKLFTHLQSQVSQYKNIDKALRIEHQFAYIISKQIQSGFYLDQQEALDLYNTLAAEYNTLELTIKSMMPCIKENTHYKLVIEQKRLLSETDTTYTYVKGKNGKIETKPFKFIDPNPTSRQQIASFLQSKGWEPKEFTETNLPQINEKILESIKLPEAKLISRLFRVQKQMGMIKDGSAGWLKCINPVTGRVHGDVHTNATNTGRCSHSKPNMSQVDKKDLRMRNVWKAKEGWSLVGIDAASLELRMLAHYLHYYDNGAFAHEVVHGDIHTYNQETFGLENRDSAKTLIYAMIYGGGNKKLGKIFYNDKGEHITSENVLLRAGSKLKTHINETFTGYQELVTDVTQAFGSRGYLLGLDGRPLHPRKEYSALNLLLQSAGAITMKQALINSYKELSKSFTYEEDYIFVANVHDEIQIECKPDLAITIGKLVVNAIISAGIDMGLKCELNGEYKIGKTWAQTH